MSNATPEQLAHKRQAEEAIEEVLDILAQRFDSKLLAQLLFWRACKMFRAVHSVGMWTVKDVKDFTEGCMKNILTKLPPDQMPGSAAIDAQGNIQPPNYSKLAS